jgi:transformation/transcription domain-associated protein
MVNSLLRLGLQVASSSDTRFLTIDMLQVMFDWEQTTLTENSTKDPSAKSWVTPVGFRENMVSFLVRLCTTFDASNKTSATVIPRALSLLQQMVGANGWRDVTVGLRFFSKVLEVRHIP